MALLILGKTQCPLCRQAIAAGQEHVATTHFIGSSEHPLWRYSDAVMHYGCFQTWDQRALFVAEYNRLLGSKVWGNGTKHPMTDNGMVTTISVAN